MFMKMNDIFLTRLAKLSEKEVEELSRQSLKLNFAIYNAYQDPRYWKRRA